MCASFRTTKSARSLCATRRSGCALRAKMTMHHDTHNMNQMGRLRRSVSGCGVVMTRALYVGIVLCAGVVLAACNGGPLGSGDQSIRNTTRILGKRAFVTVTLDGGSRLVIRHSVPITRATTALDSLREVADVRL